MSTASSWCRWRLIEDFNGMADDQARARLRQCLASTRWVEAVVSGRPYRDASHVLDGANASMRTLTDEDWLEAVRAHPRIGESGGDAAASSEREQSTAMQSPPETLAALADENRGYEERFGHVFLIFASGLSGEEVLSEMRRRMKKDDRTELAESRAELAKIARLRLEKLVIR
jgi:2-oxo-4-hydroxy-4-carboxy-5-ureidoimidazoline decarboxylase